MDFQQFSIVVEAIADAAFAVDVTGRISAWNNAATELFGLAAAEAVGVKCHQTLQCSDDSGVVCSEQCVLDYAGQGTLSRANFDLRVQTKNGKLWCNLSTLNASDALGARHTIYIVRPREMRKRLEQALTEFVRTQARNVTNGAQVLSSPTAINVPLTSREIEVLKNLAKGHSTRAIANELNISSATVNNHIRHILTKLNAHTRLEAIRHAESTGVI